MCLWIFVVPQRPSCLLACICRPILRRCSAAGQCGHRTACLDPRHNPHQPGRRLRIWPEQRRIIVSSLLGIQHAPTNGSGMALITPVLTMSSFDAPSEPWRQITPTLQRLKPLAKTCCKCQMGHCTDDVGQHLLLPPTVHKHKLLPLPEHCGQLPISP